MRGARRDAWSSLRLRFSESGSHLCICPSKVVYGRRSVHAEFEGGGEIFILKKFKL